MKHSHVHRALKLVAAVGGLTHEQANSLLAEGGFAPIPKSSWDMLTERYLPYMRLDPKLVGEIIFKPMSIADVIARYRTDSPDAVDVPVFTEDEP